MTIFALTLLILICAALMAWGLIDTKRMMEYPALIGWMMMLLVIPQLIALAPIEETRVPSGTMAWTIIMALFCVIMAIVGYNFNREPATAFRVEFDEKRLIIGCAILTGIGIVSLLLLFSLPSSMLTDKMWSGLPIKYLFFAGAIRYSLALGLILYVKYKSKVSFFLILPGIIESITSIVLYGRRTSGAILAITILCCIWFNGRRVIPRSFIIAGLMFFTVFVYSIGEYRQIMKDKPSLSKLQNIEFRNPLKTESLVGAVATEMENAANIIEAVDRSGKYNYGGLLYNHIISTYIPRQIVGEKLKKSLLIDCDVVDLANKYCNYKWPFGSCTTGIAEAYSCFSFFGAAIFGLVGYIIRRFWEGAMTGDILYQILFISFLPYAIGVFNGTLLVLFAPWLQTLLFLGPVFVFAKKTNKSNVHNQSAV